LKTQPFHFRLRSFAAVGFATLLALASGLFLAVSPAGATAGLSGYAISPTPAPILYTGIPAQSASSESFVLPNTFTTAGETITFTVSPHGVGYNCAASNNSDYVYFVGTPHVAVAQGSGNAPGDTAPAITASLSSNGSDMCTSFPSDVLTLTIPTGVVLNSSSTDTFNVTISGISYDVGPQATTGLVNLAVGTTVGAGTTTAAVPNANVAVKATAGATGNSPAVFVPAGTTATISNIVVTETAAAATSTTICVAPIAGFTGFNFNGGTTTTAATPTGAGAGTVAATTVSGGDILVTVVPSTTVATVYTISGISVADGTTTGPAFANVTTGGTSCGTDNSIVTSNLAVFDSEPLLDASIAGVDSDGTAVAELAAAFPIDGGSGCVASHSVVLATDSGFPDALSASYLAGFLHTGILLTPTGNLSSETQAELQDEGITDVYVVGGSLAVSQATITQVEATPAYTCGGPGVGATTGSNITVTGPIFGATQYDTSEGIATEPGAANVTSIDLAGAYADAYNDTTGTESSAPVTTGALKTAIVASGLEFQDASAASVMAYHSQFPLILTDPSTLSPQASAGLTALGIKQVIVLGGIDAISDADVSAIQTLGISVIRIAGQDATDTAQQIASFELNQAGTSYLGLGWGATGTWNHTILVARGDFYSDALAGCVLAAVHATPLLLTENPTTVGTYLPTFLNAGGSAAGIDSLNAVGGQSGNIETIQPLGGALALGEPTLQTIAQDVAVG
jgi:putative cell wall-binding protein